MTKYIFILLLSSTTMMAQLDCSNATTLETIANLSIPVTGTQYAETSISANNIVTNTAYFAGTKVSLTNGFKVTISNDTTTFSASIGTCNDPASKEGESKTIDNYEITLYPNPVKSILNLKWARIEINTISILSTDGKIIFTDNTIKNDTDFSINIESYPNGLYFIRMQTPNEDTFIKFIKG